MSTIKRRTHTAQVKYIAPNSTLNLPIHKSYEPKINWRKVFGFTAVYLYIGYIFYVVSR